MPKKIKITSIVGARPNFMKIAPLTREFARLKIIEHLLIHTGQHYDREMSGNFFKDLGIRTPDFNLNVGSGSHAVQTANIMIELEKIFIQEKPNLIVVVGDVNSTVAASLTASKLHIPIAHVEAGLRSYDRDMPEEINRIITDQLSDFLFTTEPEAKNNLIKEGIKASKIFFVGNIMIDTLIYNLKKAKKLSPLKKYGLDLNKYSVVTLHRPGNVDNKKTLTNILGAFSVIQKDIPIVWPVHPRTKNMIKKFKLTPLLKKQKNIYLLPPISYLEFLSLMANAKFVMTDSGGIQEETTALKIPCLTIRENTERPITITQGTNVLAGIKMDNIVKQSQKITKNRGKRGKIPHYWDGKTAGRITEIIINAMKKNG
ncbi:MAG: UDP-N-acetylglucosamine 2-epimerase (non-hydrolyzing) [Patescibacteria group bacterium]